LARVRLAYSQGGLQSDDLALPENLTERSKTGGLSIHFSGLFLRLKMRFVMNF